MRTSPLNAGFRMKHWEVLPLEGELRSADGVERLEPKVMRLLVCLAEQAGQAVTRDTLIDEVWDGRVVSDEALFRCVAELRKRLGDSSSAPVFVQTVHKIGYRLIAPVERAAVDRGGEGPRRTVTQDAALQSIDGWPHPLELDGLEIIRLLGSGSMANVFLARDVALERLVAVKTFIAGQTIDDNARKRLLREARAVARFSHPHVAAVYRVGELPDGEPYIVQQYIDGANLAQILHVERKLDTDRSLHIMRSVASAVAAAHAKRIIHRDIKPANIILDAAGEHAYLTDFGLAGIQETGHDNATRLTLAGEVLGEPRYISPEQARGEPVTPASDIYSFGVVAFLMLSGRYPYDESVDPDPAMLHVRARPLDLLPLVPELTADTATLVQRCLEKTADLRPTAEQLTRLLGNDSSAIDTVADSRPKRSLWIFALAAGAAALALLLLR